MAKLEKYYFMGSKIIGPENHRMQPLINTFNTFLSAFYKDVHGLWTQNDFIKEDVQTATNFVLDLCNNFNEDKLTIGMLNFIEKCHPCKEYENWCKNAYGYFPFHDECPQTIRGVLLDVLKLFNQESIQEMARSEFKKAGLPFISISFND